MSEMSRMQRPNAAKKRQENDTKSVGDGSRSESREFTASDKTSDYRVIPSGPPEAADSLIIISEEPNETVLLKHARIVEVIKVLAQPTADKDQSKDSLRKIAPSRIAGQTGLLGEVKPTVRHRTRHRPKNIMRTKTRRVVTEAVDRVLKDNTPLADEVLIARVQKPNTERISKKLNASEKISDLIGSRQLKKAKRTERPQAPAEATVRLLSPTVREMAEDVIREYETKKREAAQTPKSLSWIKPPKFRD